MIRIVSVLCAGLLAFGEPVLASDFLMPACPDEKRAEELRKCLDKERAARIKVHESFKRAVTLLGDQAQLLKHIKGIPASAELSPGEKPLGHMVFYSFSSLLNHLYDHEGGGYDNLLEAMRPLLANGAWTRTLFDTTRPVLVAALNKAIGKGIITDLYLEDTVAAVLSKPFDRRSARLASNWYYQCDLSPDQRQSTCDGHQFPTWFKVAYGMEPSSNAAFLLGFLNRRYLQGGIPLVETWMGMANELRPIYVPSKSKT